MIDDIVELTVLSSMVNYGNKITHDEFDGLKGFAIDGGLKDAS